MASHTYDDLLEELAQLNARAVELRNADDCDGELLDYVNDRIHHVNEQLDAMDDYDDYLDDEEDIDDYDDELDDWLPED